MKNTLLTLTVADLTPSTVQAVQADASNTGDEGAAQGGTYAAQTFSCTYTVEVTTAGAYGGTGEVTITADYGTDRNISDTVNPTSGVGFAVGTIGVTLTLTDGGDSVLTLGDTWTIKCSGTNEIVDSYITVESPTGKPSERYPKRLQFTNNTGVLIGFNILSNAEEVEEYQTDQTNFDLIRVANGSQLKFSDIHPMPTMYRLVISDVLAGGAAATLVLEMMNMQPRG